MDIGLGGFKSNNFEKSKNKKGKATASLFLCPAHLFSRAGNVQARKDKQAKVVLRTSFHHFCLLVWKGEAKPSP